MAVYSVRAVGGRVAGLDFNKVLREAFERAPALKLGTLDLLHLVACRAAGCEEFATLDPGVAGRADAVSRELGVRVVTAV